MFYQESRKCPRCGKKGDVVHTQGVHRYRKCTDQSCGYTWKTQEIMQEQADELYVWYRQQIREGGPAVQDVIERAQALGAGIQQLIDALGMEVNSDTNSSPA